MVRKIRGKAAGSTTAQDVWAQNIAKTHITTAVKFAFASGSAADAAAGTGARTIRATLLLDDGAVVDEIVTMNGQTKVESAYPLVYRLLNMEVLTVGSGGVSAGEIYAFDTSDTVTAGVPQTATKIFGRISAGQTENLGGHYTIPKGMSGKINQVFACFPDITTTAKYGYIEVQYKPLLSTLWKRYCIIGISSASNMSPTYIESVPETLPELTDIRMQYRQSAACEAFGIIEIDLEAK